MMKNVGASFVNMYTPLRSDAAGFENATNHRQPRFYSPLLGIIFANLLLNTAIAKFAPLGSLRVSYDSAPWIAYNKPNNNHHYNYNYQDSYWKPVTPTTLEGEYGPPTAPQLTTPEGQHVYHHHHVIDSIAGQQQIININNDKPPIEIEIDTNKDPSSNYEDLIPAESNIYTVPATVTQSVQEKIKSSINSSSHRVDYFLKTDDLIPSSSNIRRNTYRGTPLRSVNTGNFQRYTPTTRNKYQYNNYRRRFRPATESSNYFYDNYDYNYGNYDDYTTGRLNSKRRTLQKRPATFYRDNSENSSDYDQIDDDSFDDYSTKPYKRKRPTKQQSKNKNSSKKKNKRKQQEEQRQRQSSSSEYEFDENTEPVTPLTRQRRPSVTTEATTIGTPTTTMNITDITTGSTPSPSSNTTSNNSTGYEYGPSNGNENISFTYGPPQSAIGGGYFPSRPPQAYGPPQTGYGAPSVSGHYQVPFPEWYSQDANRHGHFGKHQDIATLDGFF